MVADTMTTIPKARMAIGIRAAIPPTTIPRYPGSRKKRPYPRDDACSLIDGLLSDGPRRG